MDLSDPVKFTLSAEMLLLRRSTKTQQWLSRNSKNWKFFSAYDFLKITSDMGIGRKSVPAPSIFNLQQFSFELKLVRIPNSVLLTLELRPYKLHFRTHEQISEERASLNGFKKFSWIGWYTRKKEFMWSPTGCNKNIRTNLI